MRLVGLYIFFGGSGADHLQIMRAFLPRLWHIRAAQPFRRIHGHRAAGRRHGGSRMPAKAVCGLARRDGDWTAGELRLRWPGLPLRDLSRLACWRHGVAGHGWGIGCAALVMLVALPSSKLPHGLALVVAVGVLTLGLWRAGALPDALVLRLTSSLTRPGWRHRCARRGRPQRQLRRHRAAGALASGGGHG